MLRILISRQSRYPADTKKLKACVRDMLKKRGVTDCEISIALVGERKMKELAKTHLGEENVLHEVLSFPALEGKEEFVNPPIGLSLGDIAICYPEARRLAMRRNKLVDDVLKELIEHGVLHLLGVHHD